jgi:hypothetical protein
VRFPPAACASTRATRIATLARAALFALGASLPMAACVGLDATGLGDEAELPSPLAPDAGREAAEAAHEVELGCGHDAAIDTHAISPPLFEVGVLD